MLTIVLWIAFAAGAFAIVAFLLHAGMPSLGPALDGA
jgi:hypothetical protein